jgi:uncharacterized protein YbaP (TraB family)
MRLLLLLVFFSTLCPAQGNGRYPSLLWKITGKDMKKPSYLYGTMHVSNRVAWHLSEEFFQALKSVDVVGLETNPGQWLDNMQKTGELSEISRPKASIGYHNDFYANAFRQVLPERKMLQAVLSYDPDIINGLLYRQNTDRENFEENTYVDLFIFQTASKLNKQVISLEDFTDAEIQARLAALPDEENEENSPRQSPSISASRIEDAYRAGNLDLLDSLSRQMTSENAQKHLITARNRYFAASIDSVLQHQSLFSGVGAAHLPGSDGLIEMLRRKGYTVEPVSGSFNKKSHGERDKLEKLEKSIVFTRQFLPDSEVSAELPGKLYPIFESPALSYHIQPDMINGHFYTIVRLRHLAAVMGQSAEDMRLRVDSLLFENIAGKIIDKRFINSAAGLPGLEVLARTARGDEQRYRIYFNDLEMFLFKLGGKGHYASGKEANRFFNSIHFEAGANPTDYFSPPAGGFKLKSKAPVSYFAISPGVIGLTEEALIPDKGQTIILQHSVYNDFSYLEEDTFELSRLVKNVIENNNFQAKGVYSFSDFQNLPSVRFQAYSDKGQKLDGRLVIKGVHYYLLLQFSKAGQETDYRCFDSFELTDFKSLHPIRKIRDTDFLFTADDEVTDDEASRFNASYARAYQNAFVSKDTKGEKDLVFRSASKQYYSPSTNEYVNITFEKYDQYDYRNKKEFMAHLDSALGRNSGMRRTDLQIKDENGTLTYNFILKDTATSRAIKTRLIFRNSTMHELSVPYDTLAGLSAWTAGFLNSFTPIDSSAGPGLFSPHFEDLLLNLSSKDSVLQQEAVTALSAIGYAKEYTGAFLDFLKGPVFPRLDEAAKAQMLVSGGTLKSNQIIPVYRQLYKNYTDSFFLQLSVLKGLAYLRTEEAYLTFAQLLTEEPALVGNESMVNDVFSVLRDSVFLCKKMFPTLLNLRQYEEYRSPVYQLLADLSARKLISPTLLVPQLPLILEDAMLAIKRQGQVKTQKNSNRQENLTDLQNYSGYQNEVESTSFVLADRGPLQSFAAILAPYYSTSPLVKLYFEKLFKVKEQSEVMPSLIDLLRYFPTVQDSLVKSFSNSLLSRAEFYQRLNQAQLGRVFPSSARNEIELSRSFLLSREYDRNSGSRERIKDTLQFLRKIPASNKYQKGDLLVFKTNNVAQPLWKIVFVKSNKAAQAMNLQLFDDSFVPDPGKNEDENIIQVADKFSMSFRKRAGSGMFN